MERDRLLEREKRKALWSQPCQAAEGRSANAWESKHFKSDQELLAYGRDVMTLRVKMDI